MPISEFVKPGDSGHAKHHTDLARASNEFEALVGNGGRLSEDGVSDAIAELVKPVGDILSSGRLSPESVAETVAQGASAAIATQQGLEILRKSTLAFTPDGWSKKGRGVAPVGVFAAGSTALQGPILRLNPQFTQLLTANAMTGGAVGSLDTAAGGTGALPVGWVEHQPNAKKVILEVGNGVLEWRSNNLWSGTYGGAYTSQTFSAAITLGLDAGIFDVPAGTQIQLLFGWRNASTGAITNVVGSTSATATAAPYVSTMPKTRISVEMVAPSAESNLIVLASPVAGDATAGIQPRIRLEGFSFVLAAEMGGRPEQIPPYLPAGVYPASDAIVALPNGDYALIAITQDRTFIPLSVQVTDGTLSLLSAIGGIGRYSHLYVIPSASYSPLDLSTFMPISLRSGLATPPGATHSRGVMHLAAQVMGKRSSSFLSGVNGGSNDRAVQLATGARFGRFEVILGERDPDDGPGQNRSEVAYYRTYPYGQAFGWAGWIHVKSLQWEGASVPEKYCLLTQFRYAADPDPGASPELALEGLGTDRAGHYRLRLLTRSGTAVQSPTPPTVNRFDAILPFGWIYVGIEGTLDPAGAARLNMWINSTGARGGQQQVVNTNGIPWGYSNATGFRVRMGAYANNWNTPREIEHQSTEFSLGLDVLSRVTAPPPRLVA